MSPILTRLRVVTLVGTEWGLFGEDEGSFFFMAASSSSSEIKSIVSRADDIAAVEVVRGVSAAMDLSI